MEIDILAADPAARALCPATVLYPATVLCPATTHTTASLRACAQVGSVVERAKRRPAGLRPTASAATTTSAVDQRVATTSKINIHKINTHKITSKINTLELGVAPMIMGGRWGMTVDFAAYPVRTGPPPKSPPV